MPTPTPVPARAQPLARVRSRALRLGIRSTPFQGRVSFASVPTEAQFRFLVFVLAHHGPNELVFRPINVSLDYIYGPLLVGATSKTVARLALDLFGKRSPTLIIEELDAAGGLVYEGSFCVMPLLSHLTYIPTEQQIIGCLNDHLVHYLPQLLALMPAELMETLPFAFDRPLRLVA